MAAKRMQYPVDIDLDQLELLRWTVHMRHIERQLTDVTKAIASDIWGKDAWAQEILTQVLHVTLGMDSQMLKGAKFSKPEAKESWDTELLFRGLWQHSTWLEKVLNGQWETIHSRGVHVR